ncbi:hypothetical protein [Streptomyces sp. B1I3]|uniref:hypothetical protein n=1 Tax=Streptomyces sp. B1I3 TaxID=3042264 RepID=UPI002788A304|nr:hypothetical protein [Streptomyces sp. B1I3]MDQ0796666.1 hypothetical protein [Streptomyces sp. B1I3]
MTGCTVETKTTGSTGTATTGDIAPEPAEPDPPAESGRPPAGGPSDVPDGIAAARAADVPGRSPGAGWSRAATMPAGAAAYIGTARPEPVRGGADATAVAGRAGVPEPAASATPDEALVSAARGGPLTHALLDSPGGFPAADGAPVTRAPRAGAGRRPRPQAPRRLRPPALTIAADRSYAARLTTAAGSTAAGGTDPAWFTERWTLDGPEPYAVPLPLDQPEEADSDVLPLADGRVLIRRRVADRHAFSLLYPTGPGTGELPLGALACTDLTLLPPSPDGMSAYALLPGERSTAVWLVAGGAFGPEHVADVPGRCSGGAWLDREGRLLALDRQLPGGGPVKAVAVDLERGGEVTPLLQIAPDSNDRLLLADADSGLLLIRSDAPGHDRLGWGVLGSCLPVRFPECLHPSGVTMTPFAVQPGQMLMPESCAVALRIDGRTGSWVGLWRPLGRRLHLCAAPEGWLAGTGFWTREGVLHLPYAQEGTPCAVALVQAPAEEEHRPAGGGAEPSVAEGSPLACKPVPLGQAPLTGRTPPG